jgi:hypothetical protein
MSRKLSFSLKTILATATAWSCVQVASAQTFTYNLNDLILTLRKTGTHQENNSVVVDIGQASNYLNTAIGSSITVTQFSSSQLVSGSFSSLNYLTWAVTGYHPSGTTYPGYPAGTLWLTVPRTNNSVPTTAPTRLDTGSQTIVKGKINSVWANASYISQQLGTSNQFNTPTLVREPIATYPNNILDVWMKGVIDPTQGTLNDTWPATEPNGGNVEFTTPGTFTNSARCDLYEIRPLTDSQGNLIVDPHTGTNGPAYYVGYFQFNSDGSMTFKRDATSTAPPAPQIVSVQRSGNTSTIYFTTANGPTYSLRFTNAAGLTAPVSNWPSSTTTLVGNGNTNSLSDTTTDPVRFYKVAVH